MILSHLFQFFSYLVVCYKFRTTIYLLQINFSLNTIFLSELTSEMPGPTKRAIEIRWRTHLRIIKIYIIILYLNFY